MILNTIEIQNFLSIKNINFTLHDRGLVLIQGKNLDDNNFDSNGAGKTSLIEALSWVLFGKTVKGLKGDEIVHNKVKKNCSVKLSFTDDDNNNYLICRYRKDKVNKNSVLIYKNDMELTGKSDKDTTEYIESLFQMNYEVFTATLLYSSHSFKFTSSSDAEMKKSLDTMLNFEIWNKCLNEAKERKNIKQYELDTTTNNLNQCKSSKAALSTQLILLREKEETSKKTWLKNKNNYLTKIQELTKELEKLISSPIDEAALNKYEDIISDLNDKMMSIQFKLNKYEKMLGDINNTSTNISILQGSIKSCIKCSEDLKKKAQKYLDKLTDKKNLIDTYCPVCGSYVTADSLKNVTKELSAELKNISNELKENDDCLKRYKNLLKLEEAKLKTLKDKYSVRDEVILEEKSYKQDMIKALNEKSKIENSISSYTKEKKRLEEMIEAYKTSLKECDEKINTSFSDAISNLMNNIDYYTEKEMHLEADISRLTEEVGYLDDWIFAFSNKGIKSLLLDNVTPFLNKRANYYLNMLTSGSIEIEFTTQCETKSKELRDKFTLNIINKNGGDKYIANSDGERRRIDIAVNLALQDLISFRSNKKINISFFDECFDSLDGVGCERIIEVLQENINNKSSIFVATHNEQLKALFDRSIILVKKNGFTELKENI